MLTSLYYYGYYKPYILGETKASDIQKLKSAPSAAVYSKNASKPFSYFLNKSVKEEISRFAANISENLNGIKDSSKYIAQNLNEKNYDFERKQNIADGMEDFVYSYNSNKDFLKQNKVDTLNSYLGILEDDIMQSPDAMKDFELSFENDGSIIFDRNSFMKKNAGDIDEKAGANMFNSLYDDTCDAMTAPLSKHMNFKSLDYYYNYSYAQKDKNSFRLIETGLIVDIAL